MSWILSLNYVYCIQINEVLTKGETFYTNQEHCFCTGGVVATGIVQPLSEEERDERFIEKIGAKGTDCYEPC